MVSLHERTLDQLTIVNQDTDQEVSLRPLPGLAGNSYRFTGVVAEGWEQFKPETSVNSISATTDGLLLVRTGSLWTWGSSDFGKTWWKLDTDLAHLAPVFSDRLTGYTISLPLPLLKASVPALRKTTDAGKTWTVIGSIPPTSTWYGRLLYDDKRRRLGFMSPDGSVLWSEDDGRSWR